MAFFIWLEGTAVSEWIRGSPSLWGFPFILYLHTLGLALISGLSSAVALGIIFLPEKLPRSPLQTLFPLMWTGLAINALSGIALLIAYPAKAMTNPVFYIKLVAIAAAIVIVSRLQRQLPATINLKPAAWTLLGLWLIATTTGRLLAYTHSILMASEPSFFY